MGVVRGKVFTDIEMVTVVKTEGDWELREQEDGTWIHEVTGEVYEAVSVAEALARYTDTKAVGAKSTDTGED